MPPWRTGAAGLRLIVRLTPKATVDRIEGMKALSDGREAIMARVRPAPEDGANAALLRLLADAFDLPRSAVSLVKGHTARLKEVAVSGDPAALLDRAERLWAKSIQSERDR